MDGVGRLFTFLFGTIFLFMFPLTLINLKVDDMRQVEINDAVVEFVDNAKASGEITSLGYTQLVSRVAAAYPKCDISIVYEQSIASPVEKADGTFGVKRTLFSYDRQNITDYIYYETDNYGNVIVDGSGHKVNRTELADFPLKQGGYLTVTVKSKDITPGTGMVRLFLPGYTGNTLYTCYSGYVGNSIQTRNG